MSGIQPQQQTRISQSPLFLIPDKATIYGRAPRR